MIDNRIGHPFILRRGDHKVIGKRAVAAEIQHDQIFRQPLIRRVDDFLQ